MALGGGAASHFTGLGPPAHHSVGGSACPPLRGWGAPTRAATATQVGGEAGQGLPRYRHSFVMVGGSHPNHRPGPGGRPGLAGWSPGGP